MNPSEKHINTKAISMGDSKAFESLFMLYFPRIKGFINGLLQNNEEAEDIAQDIFVNLWQNRQSLQQVDNLNAYLYRIAKNTVYRHIERSLLFQNYQQRQIELSITATDNDEIEKQIYANELELLINIVVEHMPTQRRNIFKMSREEGLNNDEIATRLCISKRTVENHLTTALASIRKTMTFFIWIHFI